MWTRSSAPHLSSPPWPALRALGSVHSHVLEANARLFGQGLLGSGVLRVWSGGGEDGGPITLMTVSVMDGDPVCFYWEPLETLHQDLPFPGEEPLGLRGVPGLSPHNASSQIEAGQRTGRPSPLLASQSRLCGIGGGFTPIWSPEPCLGLGFVPILQVQRLKVRH